ncbi:fibroblast growth factor 1-like [Daktulosphaira vitifoliae]|uniref:fibroblast growth factor 1-like n=1 Tax=Daktulosphaira vitifoliae TaxID=58002 RepID=UPI0021A99E90|nr:fibroblast growth factor 1-like [Daktulosphaira vitifoliae]
MDQQKTHQTTKKKENENIEKTLQCGELSVQFVKDTHNTTSVTNSPMRHYGRRMKLNCRSGYCLAILPDGTVTSSDDDLNKFCVIEFTSMLPGHVRIRGVESNLYLAMNKQSILYGESNPKKKSTIFIEQPQGPYSTFLSFKHQHKNWFVAIKKNGKIKLGSQTRRGQNSTNFLPLMV